MKRYELAPVDGRKSFYGKAYVEINHDGSETLYSYQTPIIRRETDGTFTRLWGGWSATTGRHINAFCGMRKADFVKLPHTLTPYEKALTVLSASALAALLSILTSIATGLPEVE